MDEHIFDKVQEVDMQKTMENYYIDYAKLLVFGVFSFFFSFLIYVYRVINTEI